NDSLQKPSATLPSGSVETDHYGTGAISGTVKLAEPPKSTSGILMSGDVFCARVGKGQPIMPPGRKVGPDGTLPYVFTYIKSGLPGKYSSPGTPMVLNQKECHYEPHVFGLMVNQPLEIRNDDPTAHNIHAMAEKNEAFNIAQAQQGATATKVFTRPEVMVK